MISHVMTRSSVPSFLSVKDLKIFNCSLTVRKCTAYTLIPIFNLSNEFHYMKARDIIIAGKQYPSMSMNSHCGNKIDRISQFFPIIYSATARRSFFCSIFTPSTVFAVSMP